MQYQHALLNEDQLGWLINAKDSQDQGAIILDRLLLNTGAMVKQQGIKETNEQSNGQQQNQSTIQNNNNNISSSLNTSIISPTNSFKDGYSAGIINWSSSSNSPSSCQQGKLLNTQELDQSKEWIEFEEFQTDKNIQNDRQSYKQESYFKSEKKNIKDNQEQQQQQEQLAKTVANLRESLSQQQTENAQLHSTIQSLQDKQQKDQVNMQLSAMNQELKLNAMSQELVLMKTQMLSMKSMYVAKIKDQAMLVKALTARLKLEDKTRCDQEKKTNIKYQQKQVEEDEDNDDQQLDLQTTIQQLNSKDYCLQLQHGCLPNESQLQASQQMEILQSYKQQQNQNSLCQRVYQQLRSQQAKQQQQQDQQHSQVLSHPLEQPQQSSSSQSQYLSMNFPDIEIQQQLQHELSIQHKSEAKETNIQDHHHQQQQHHNNSIQSSSSLSCNGSTQLNSQQQSINTQINSHTVSQQLHTATSAHQLSHLRIEDTFKEESKQSRKEIQSQSQQPRQSQTPSSISTATYTKLNQTQSIHKAISNINTNREKKKLAINNNNNNNNIIISPTSSNIPTPSNIILPATPQHLLSSVIRRKTPRSTTTNTLEYQQPPDELRSSSVKQHLSQNITTTTTTNNNNPNNISILKKKRQQLLQQTLQLTYSPRNLHGIINQQIHYGQQCQMNSPGNLSSRLMGQIIQSDAGSGSGSCTNRSISAGFNGNNCNKHSLKCLIAGGTASGIINNTTAVTASANNNNSIYPSMIPRTSKNKSSSTSSYNNNNNNPDNLNNNNTTNNSTNVSFLQHFFSPKMLNSPMMIFPQQQQKQQSTQQIPQNKHSFPDQAISQLTQSHNQQQSSQQPQPRQSLNNNTHKIFTKLTSPRGLNSKNHKQSAILPQSNHNSPIDVNDENKQQNITNITTIHQYKSIDKKQPPQQQLVQQLQHINDNIQSQQQINQQQQLILSSLQINTAIERNIGYQQSMTNPSHECISGILTTTSLSQQTMKESQEDNKQLIANQSNKTKRHEVQSLHETGIGQNAQNTSFLPIKKRYPARSMHSTQQQQTSSSHQQQHIYHNIHNPPSQSLNTFTIDLSTQYPVSSNTTTIIPSTNLNSTLVTPSSTANPSSNHPPLTTKHITKRCVSAKPSHPQQFEPSVALSSVVNNTNKHEEQEELNLQQDLMIQSELLDNKGNNNKRVRTLKTNNFIIPENNINIIHPQNVVIPASSNISQSSQRQSSISAGFAKNITPVRNTGNITQQQQQQLFLSKNQQKN